MDLPRNIGQDGHSSRTDLVIHLIKAELKSRKFTRALEEVGFDTTFYSIDLSSQILDLIGFDARTDETFEIYHKLLEAFVQKIDLRAEDTGLNVAARGFYKELMAAKSG